MLKSLRTQLSLVLLCILLVTILTISVLANWFIRREFEAYILRQETTRSENILNDLENQYNPFTKRWDMTFLHTIGMYSLYDGYILKIYTADGSMAWDAENHDTALCGQIMSEISTRMIQAKREGEFVTNTYAINYKNTQVGTVAMMYYGPFFFTENDYLFIKTLDTILLVIGGISLICALIIGRVLARRISDPITQAAVQASKIAKGDYDITLEVTSSAAEIEVLVTAVNDLARALASQELLRKRLTSDIAHELRTPLTAVSSHLEAMIEGIWEPTPERLKSCYDELGRLSNLVSDLGKLAKLEDGNDTLDIKATDLYELARTAVINLESKALVKQQQLIIKGDSTIIECDADRILQVLMNLIGNAIAYTETSGIIEAKVYRFEHSAFIEICDNGVGIAPEALPHIFERFYRTDQSRSRKTGGTGIGLTIALSFVRAHGGDITVKSAVGEGSCFTVMLPLTHNRD